jgi:hypothetical protein
MFSISDPQVLNSSARTLGRWPDWRASLAEAPTTRRSGPRQTWTQHHPRSCRESSTPRHSLPACPAEALHLRFAGEGPTAVQAEKVPSALGPPIARDWKRRALEVRYLSVIRDAVGAHQYRVGAEGTRGTQRRHGVSLSRGHGDRRYRPRGGVGRTRLHPGSVNTCPSMPGGGLPSLPSGFGLLALALHGRLFVVGPPLHFLEHSALQHLPLEGFQRRLDLVIEDLDPQWRTFLPQRSSSLPPLCLRPGHGRPEGTRGIRTRAGQASAEPLPRSPRADRGPHPALRDDENDGPKERDERQRDHSRSRRHPPGQAYEGGPPQQGRCAV